MLTWTRCLSAALLLSVLKAAWTQDPDRNPEEAIQEILQEFDADKDSMISLDEWNAIIDSEGLREEDASDEEKKELQKMESEFPKALIKTVKFQSQPTAKEHLRQLEVVAEKFERIVRKPRSLKVVLEKKSSVV